MIMGEKITIRARFDTHFDGFSKLKCLILKVHSLWKVPFWFIHLPNKQNSHDWSSMTP